MASDPPAVALQAQPSYQGSANDEEEELRIKTQLRHLATVASRLIERPEHQDLIVRMGTRRYELNYHCAYATSTFFRRAHIWHGKFRLDLALHVPGLMEFPSVADAAIRFLRYGIYNDEEYDRTEMGSSKGASPLLFNYYVYKVGLRMEMPDLCLAAERKFGARAEEDLFEPHFMFVVEEIFTFGHEHEDWMFRKRLLQACSTIAVQLLAPIHWLEPDDFKLTQTLRIAVPKIAAFRDGLLELAKVQAHGVHDCDALGCRGAWHHYRCYACWREFSAQGCPRFQGTISALDCMMCGELSCCKVDAIDTSSGGFGVGSCSLQHLAMWKKNACAELAHNERELQQGRSLPAAEQSTTYEEELQETDEWWSPRTDPGFAS
ncbi:hypothetical protein Slin14017_G078230 [Septoria linicola]|nr:hypothetical protein Slin14017_G078230 [Septoria linicola]